MGCRHMLLMPALTQIAKSCWKYATMAVDEVRGIEVGDEGVESSDLKQSTGDLVVQAATAAGDGVLVARTRSACHGGHSV